MTPFPTNASKSRILSLYRSLCRRLYFSPLDPKATQNLFRIQRHYFRKKINHFPLTIPTEIQDENIKELLVDENFAKETLEYRLKLGENHLNSLRNAFINGNEKSLLYILKLAFAHSHVNNKYIAKTWKYNVPKWLTEFKLGDGNEYLNFWPVKRLAVVNKDKSGHEGSTELSLEVIKERFDRFYNTINEYSSGSGQLSSNYHDIISMHSKKPPPEPSKCTEEKELKIKDIIKKISKLVSFLKGAEGKIHKRSVFDFSPLIPLHKLGYPLVYERQRNIVLRRIREIKELLNIIQPFNYIYYLFIKNFIENNHFNSQNIYRKFETQKARNMNKNKKLKNNSHNDKKYKDATLYITSYHFSDPKNVFLRQKYLEMINKEYSIIENDKIVYLDTLLDFKEADANNECFEMSEISK